MASDLWQNMSLFPGISHVPFITVYNSASNRMFVIIPKFVALDKKRDVLNRKIFGPPMLYEYVFQTDKWKQYIIQGGYSSSFTIGNSQAVVMTQNSIFLHNEGGKIVKFTLMKNFKCMVGHVDNMHDELPTFYLENRAALAVNNQIHIVPGGQRNDKHITYDIKTNKCNELNNLKKSLKLGELGLYGAAFVKIDDTQFLLFGGYSDGFKLESINKYDVQNQKWDALQSKIPKCINQFNARTSVVVLRGQIILFFCIAPGIQHIYMYYVKEDKFQKSKCQYLISGGCQVIAHCDPKRDDSTVFGFVNQAFQNIKFPEHLFLPEYLIRIICKYYINQYVHVLSNFSKQHCKINVMKILE